MAQPIHCDGPDDGLAMYLVTNTETGDIAAFCAGCYADFSQAYLQAVDPGRLAPPPARPPRKRRKATPTAVADDPDGGESVGTGPAAAPGTP